jgi:serine/threonine-protein kinase
MYSSPQFIKGKWNKRTYEIIRELGRGANGTVYLATLQNNSYAIKIGEDPFSMTSEVNVLKHFGKAQGSILGPSVYDVDDWEEGGKAHPFYVMNVIEGTPLLSFIKKRGKDWIPVFIIQLLGFLKELHEQGWIFGDLKPDNLQITGHPPKIAWFDAGGMTKKGRAIKEYTEAYDRGYWQMGTRKAEPSYDLFSVALIVLYLHFGESVEPGEDGKSTLHHAIYSDSSLYPFQAILHKAVEGKYTTAAEMKQEMIEAWHIQKGGTLGQPEQETIRRSTKVKKQSRLKSAISFLFLSSFLIFIFTLYLFTQTY